MEKTCAVSSDTVATDKIDKLIALLRAAKEQGMELTSIPSLSFQEAPAYQF